MWGDFVPTKTINGEGEKKQSKGNGEKAIENRKELEQRK